MGLQSVKVRPEVELGDTHEGGEFSDVFKPGFVHGLCAWTIYVATGVGYLRTTTSPLRYSPSGKAIVIGWSGAPPMRSEM